MAAHFEVSDRGSGEGQGDASEHPGCEWSAVGDQPEHPLSDASLLAPADHSTRRHRRLHLVAAGDRASANGIHRSLGSFGDRAVDSFRGRARAIASTGIDLLGLPGVEPPAGLIAKLRSFDSIVSWYGANRAEFREHVARLGLPFQFLDALPPPGARIHAADFFLRQAGGEGSAVPRIECDARATRRFRRDPSVFRKRAEELAAGAISGSGGAAVDSGAMVRGAGRSARWRGAIRRISTNWPAGLRVARVYIGNDSGITHLAAAVGTPVVAIFGPTDPAVWAYRAGRNGSRVVRRRLRRWMPNREQDWRSLDEFRSRDRQIRRSGLERFSTVMLRSSLKTLQIRVFGECSRPSFAILFRPFRRQVLDGGLGLVPFFTSLSIFLSIGFMVHSPS